MCMSVHLPVCMCMPGDTEAREGCPGTGATDNCEPPGRCWELKLGSSARAEVLVMAEPSLQTSVDVSVVLSPGRSKYFMSTWSSCV